MVANAGIVKAGDFLDFSEEDFDRVLRVNLKGVFLCGQAAARQMVKQGARPDGSAGAIVNMSSINAVVAIPSITPYCVATGGVNQLTKVMALALAAKGIRVSAIGPRSEERRGGKECASTGSSRWLTDTYKTKKNQ